jgi:hypothetical protein
MCAFTVNLIDFDRLSAAQRKALLKNLRNKKNTLKGQLQDVNRSLKGVNKAIKVIEKKKSKRRA